MTDFVHLESREATNDWALHQSSSSFARSLLTVGAIHGAAILAMSKCVLFGAHRSLLFVDIDVL